MVSIGGRRLARGVGLFGLFVFFSVSVVDIPALIPAAISSSVPPESSGSSVWFATHNAAYRVDSTTTEISATLPVPHETQDLAIDPANHALWVLAHRHLYKFDSTTSLVREVDLLADQTDDPKQLRLDPRDGRVWVVGQNSLLAVSREGDLLLQWRAPGPIRDMALGVDGAVWLLAQQQILKLARDGRVLESAGASRRKTSSPDRRQHWCQALVDRWATIAAAER